MLILRLKDMVFVLNPAPFITAGVEPNRVEGWVFAKVTVDDENGKPVELDKLLKPFDISLDRAAFIATPKPVS